MRLTIQQSKCSGESKFRGMLLFSTFPVLSFGQSPMTHLYSHFPCCSVVFFTWAPSSLKYSVPWFLCSPIFIVSTGCSACSSSSVQLLNISVFQIWALNPFSYFVCSLSVIILPNSLSCSSKTQKSFQNFIFFISTSNPLTKLNSRSSRTFYFRYYSASSLHLTTAGGRAQLFCRMVGVIPAWPLLSSNTLGQLLHFPLLWLEKINEGKSV